jgi:hypothetical protein
VKKKLPNKPNPNAPPSIQSIVVDAIGTLRTSDMEYQGFNFSTKERLFRKGPYAERQIILVSFWR